MLFFSNRAIIACVCIVQTVHIFRIYKFYEKPRTIDARSYLKNQTEIRARAPTDITLAEQI